MKFFENKLKNRLKDAASREGVDADDLWADIAGALPPEKAKGKYWRLSLLLPLLLIGGGALWFGLSDIQEENSGLTESNIAAYDAQKNTIEPTKIEEIKEINIRTNAVESIENKTIETIGNISNSTIIAQEKELSKTIKTASTNAISKDETIQNRKNFPAFNENLDTPFVTHKTDKKPKEQVIAFEQSGDSKTVVSNSEKEKLPPQDLQAIDLLRARPFFVSQEEKEEDLSDLALPMNPLLESKGKDEEKKKLFQIGLVSGVNILQNNFDNSPEGELLQNAYKARVAYNVGAEVQLKLRKNLYLTTGLEYTKTMTQFNLVQERFGIADNPNTVIEDLVNAKISRTVKHHNRLDFITLPLVLSVRKEYGKFNLGIGAGLGFNAVINQRGKTLNAEGAIVEYSGATATAVLTPYKSFISYHLRPSVLFKATEILSIELRPELRYVSHGQSDFFGVKHSSLISGLSLGLSFKL